MAIEDAPTSPLGSPGSAPIGLVHKPGDRIGPFVIRQKLGEGGFGMVYQADQTEPVRRAVALKVIKPGMDTAAVVARFEAERQALAMMDHPSVAKVFEGGATAEGRPYFAMELVKGLPITEHCDRNRLDVNERIELFIRVCEAVQHAHSKGVIHRDLKPSNILVEFESDRSTPKVIDFGIAKALHQRLTEATIFTHEGLLIGTPEYMSPEQAEMGRQDIDTRSDIYSLGVILYELLIGGGPFEPGTLRRASYAEIQRIIREVEPARPSTRLNSVGAPGVKLIEAGRVTHERRTDLRSLTSILRRDLDWVVMRCLEKRRDRRYETAAALAMDLRRYLAHEPVLAGPPSVGYRIGKFARRNRTAALAACVGLTLLLAGLAGTSYGLVRASRAAAREAEQRRLAVQRASEADQAREAAEAERTRAQSAMEREQTRAQELKLVSDFQADMLSQIDAAAAGAGLVSDIRTRFAEAITSAGVTEEERTLRSAQFERELRSVNATDAAATMIDRTILTPAIAAIDARFKDQPLVDASLRQTLAELYRSLGRFDDALPLQEHALASRREKLGDEAPETITSMSRLGVILQGAGKLGEAETAFREALGASRRALGDDHKTTLRLINDLALLLQARGKLAEAEPLYREALERNRRVRGEDHPETITCINNIGFLLQARGKPADAEPFIREALEKRRRVLGDDHPDTLGSMNNLGFLLLERGQMAEAETYYRTALEHRRRTLGEEHPDTLQSMTNMGFLLRRQDKPSEAEAMLRHVLEVRHRVLGDDHPSTLNSIDNVGSQLQIQGRAAEAEPYLEEALKGRRRVLGDDHPATIGSISSLAGNRQASGRLQEAEALHREALERRRRVLGDDHPDTIRAAINLGYCLQIQHRLKEAEPLYREAMDRRRRLLGDTHADTLLSIINMGSLLREMGEFAAAEPLHRESLDGYTQKFGPDHWRTADARLQLGRTLAALHRFSEAEPLLIEAQRTLSTAQGVPAGRTEQCIISLIALYESSHQTDPTRGDDAKAAEWKSRLATLQSKTPVPKPTERK